MWHGKDAKSTQPPKKQPSMQSITLTQQRKDLIRVMKRQKKPSRRLRMHIALLASDGFSPTQICRVLYCSRTTVYALAERFVEGEGRMGAFEDRGRRGLKPLLGKPTEEYVERLVEE